MPHTTHLSSNAADHHRAAFTLIELLIVIAIIAILAALGFAGVSGALTSAKKAETRAMANQIKLALSAYYAEYGTYPAVTNANPQFLRAMTGATNEPTVPNRRGIRFLEPTDKFTNSSGIVTPTRLYKDPARRELFQIAVDTNYDGRIEVPSGTNANRVTNNGSIAVWAPDPTQTNKVLGTW
jgi:prepilin-type N-terminal cleavage/methylation domain-containing protein